MIKLIVLNLLFSISAYASDQKLDWGKLNLKFDQAKVIDNHIRGLNCWGTLFYLLGLSDKLEYQHDDIMVSFLSGNNCKKLPPNITHPAGTIVHFADGLTARHSYLLGPDQMAWQKFGPDPSQYVYKEPHYKVVKWYNDIFDFRGEAGAVEYYNCGLPSQRFIKIFDLYSRFDSDKPYLIEELNLFASAALSHQNNFDDSEIFAILSMFRSMLGQNKQIKLPDPSASNFNKNFKDNYIKLTSSLLINKTPEKLKQNLQFLFSGFINELNVDLAISMLNSLGGPKILNDVSLARVFNTLALISSKQILNSNEINRFSILLSEASTKNKLFLFHSDSHNIDHLPLFERKELENTLIFRWLISVAKEWDHTKNIGSGTHISLNYLYTHIGIPYFAALPPHEEFNKMYYRPDLFPHNVFPNSHDLTDEW